jgi:hypothetical protein
MHVLRALAFAIELQLFQNHHLGRRDPALPAAPLDPPPASWSAARRALLGLEDAAGLPDLLASHPVLAELNADRWLAADEQGLRDVGDLGQAQLVAEARALLRGERG